MIRTIAACLCIVGLLLMMCSANVTAAGIGVLLLVIGAAGVLRAGEGIERWLQAHRARALRHLRRAVLLRRSDRRLSRPLLRRSELLPLVATGARMADAARGAERDGYAALVEVRI